MKNANLINKKLFYLPWQPKWLVSVMDFSPPSQHLLETPLTTPYRLLLALVIIFLVIFPPPTLCQAYPYTYILLFL